MMRFAFGVAAFSPIAFIVGKKIYEVFASEQKKRSWIEYYGHLAFCVSMRSKDPSLQVGCAIVHPKSLKILSVGYNGFPPGIENTDNNWERPNKYDFVVHAEANAVLLAGHADLEGSIAFVTMYPCAECAKMLIAKGIRQVYYLSFRQKYQDSTTLFKAANVSVMPLKRGDPPTLTGFKKNLIQKVECVLEHTLQGTPTNEVYKDLWKSTEKERNEDLPSSWRRELKSEKILLNKWTDYFLFLALIASTRALKNNQGAVLIDSDTLKIAAISYNGYPRGVNNALNDDSMEMSALTNAICLRSSEGGNFMAFSTHFPSLHEAKNLAQANVKRLYFIWPKTPEGENIDEKALNIMKGAGMAVIPMNAPILAKLKEAVRNTVGALEKAEGENKLSFDAWPRNLASYDLQPKKP